MQRFLALYSRPEDATAFREHYTTVHAPLVEALPGIRNISYAFDVTALQGDTTYGCVFEAEFDDEGASQAALGSPEGDKAAAELANFSGAGVELLTYDVARYR